MRQSLRQFILFVLFLSPFFAYGQQVTTTSIGCPGVPGACGYHSNTNTSVARSGPSNQSPQNGNGVLGSVYTNTACGLNYVSASQRIGQRFFPVGVAQPAPFVISGIPSCATVVKAYLWAEGSGNGAAQTATVNGPFGNANFPMAVVGQGPDKCWAYSGTYTYRADVTAVVGGNGTYNISGLLTNPPNAGNDMDGATLVVVYTDPSQTYRGTIMLSDGAIVVNGGVANYNMTFPAVCGPTTGAKAFMCVGDIQFNPTSWSCNGTAAPLTWNWWDYVSVNTTVSVGQTTSNFNVNTGGDCFNLCVAGLYYRTTCVACTPTPLNLTTTSTPATCSACNGTASVTVSPTGTYTYSWSPSGGNAATATGLCAGTYTVTVTSACGTGTATVVVGTAGGGITVASAGQTNLSCNAVCNGTATVTVVTGTAPFTYAWAPSGGNGPSASGLCAGIYTCTVTDAGGCTGTQTFNITQPPPFVITPSQTNTTCNGNCNGSASVVVSGGTPPYSYAWTPNGGNGSTASSLCAGNYTCTITDANNCTTTQTFTITQPSALTATSSTVPAVCGNSNGSATVVPSGGTGPYTYSWSPSGGNGPTASNLAAGPYTCVITDFNLCTYTVNVTVGVANSPSLTLTGSTNVTCNGACDGTASTTTTGGVAPFTYNWTPSGGSGPNATGLCPGSYTCTVTDANSCTSTVTLVITEPLALTATGTQTDVTCNAACNGTASVTASGGTPPYSYNWSPSGGSNPSASSLCAGNYTCTVTDANGCTFTQTFAITEPTVLTVASAGFNVSCFGVCDGQVVAIPNGGTPNYTFSWNTGCSNASCTNVCAGNFSVTVTDMNGCTATATTTVTEPPAISITTSVINAHCGQSDGSAMASYSGGTGTLSPVWYNPATPGDTMHNIPSGNYFVIVTDANGCDDTATVTLNNIAGVQATQGTITPVSCFGQTDGAATVNASGGTQPYTYAWSCSTSTGNSASNLSGGACSVVVTDSAGCTSTVNLTIPQPAQLVVTAAATPGSVCSGQPVLLAGSGSGGTPGYSYNWLPFNVPNQSQTISPTTTTSWTFVVVDASGCTDSVSGIIPVNPDPVALLVADSLSGCAPLCVNFSDLSTVATGSISQWSWDFGDNSPLSTQQNPFHCYNTAGNYSVTLSVTASGCSNTVTLPNYIHVYPLPVASYSAGPQPTTELNPEIFFTDMSTNAVSWQWSFGDTTSGSSTLQNPSFTYAGPGCYDVVLTATSVNGCTDDTTQLICIDPDVTLFIPNAFSPNGDGINDYFFPQGVGIDADQFEMWIFDRWGNMIFYTDDMAKGWNGAVKGHEDVCQEDVYIWKIKAVDQLGNKHNYIGHVTLLH